MATLHLLAHSPFTDARLKSCLRLLGEDDAILLTGDAVYALAASEWSQPLSTLKVFALEEDLLARGIEQTTAKALDYSGFVECCCQYAKVNSWL